MEGNDLSNLANEMIRIVCRESTFVELMNTILNFAVSFDKE